MTTKASVDGEKVIERLKIVFDVKRDADVAERLGIHRGSLSNWKARGFADYNLIVESVKGLDVNLHWLLTGTGPERSDEQPGTVKRLVIVAEGRRMAVDIKPGDTITFE